MSSVIPRLLAGFLIATPSAAGAAELAILSESIFKMPSENEWIFSMRVMNDTDESIGGWVRGRFTFFDEAGNATVTRRERFPYFYWRPGQPYEFDFYLDGRPARYEVEFWINDDGLRDVLSVERR